MFGKGPRTNGGDASPDQQSKSDQSVTPQQPHTVVPPSADDQVAPCDAEASQLAEPNEDGRVVVGKGAKIVGEISNCSQVEIAGELEGNAVAEVVIIRAGGRLKGGVNAKRAEVHGTMEGEIQVEEHLDIRSTGQVSGELTYGRLSIADGGQLEGNIRRYSGSQTQEPPAEPQESRSFPNGQLPESKD